MPSSPPVVNLYRIRRAGDVNRAAQHQLGVKSPDIRRQSLLPGERPLYSPNLNRQTVV